MIDRNREVSKRLGLCWHEQKLQAEFDEVQCTCGRLYPDEVGLYDHFVRSNPDFSTDAGAVELLRLMRGRGVYHLFLRYLYVDAKTIEETLDRSIVQYITTPGTLRDAVLEWKRKEEKPKINDQK
jgi:hypothetical protein